MVVSTTSILKSVLQVSHQLIVVNLLANESEKVSLLESISGTR